jgi:hypothetical protein
MNIRFQLMLPEEDHGELHRLAGETRMAAADLMRLGLRWVLANRDVLQRLPPADARRGRDDRCRGRVGRQVEAAPVTEICGHSEC